MGALIEQIDAEQNVKDTLENIKDETINKVFAGKVDLVYILKISFRVRIHSLCSIISDDPSRTHESLSLGRI